MGKTLLIGQPDVSWREWLREHRENSDLLCLDPSEGLNGPPGRLVLSRGNRPLMQRFFGSIDAQRAPHSIVAALAQALPLASTDLVVQCFAYRPSPLLRQTVQTIVHLLQPNAVLLSEGVAIDQPGERVELGTMLPTVQQAHRKALWLKMLEGCTEQEVDLRSVRIEGARLGSGCPVPIEGVRYAEKCGSTLLLVSDAEPEDYEIARALDITHCHRAHLASPDLYRNLLCSFARSNGEDFGVGIVLDIDFENRRLKALCNAVPPAPVKILRLGSLRVDPNGVEKGEAKPWQV